MRLMIVHRSRLFASCLAEVLNVSPDTAAVALAGTEPEFAAEVERFAPEIILADLDLPDGRSLPLIERLRSEFPGTRLLAVLTSEKHPDISACVEAGVSGLLLEDCSLADLKDALSTVKAGDFFCSPQLTRALFKRLASTTEARSAESAPAGRLTQREVEIVRLIAEGLSNKQIARQLSVSLYTVKNHVHNILDKLQVQSRFEAAELAHRNRLVGRTPR